MYIFIDEAGPFIPPLSMGPPSYSLVLALVLPTATYGQLCYEFLRIRDAWPNHPVEIKGSRLNEEQCKQVADLLAAFDGLIEFQIIDMGRHDTASIDGFKERQARSVTESVTALHQPTMIEEVTETANTFRALSNQLFVQAFMTMHLVMETAKIGMHYYVQRTPQELSRFTWVIDRKDRDLTAMERLWSTFIFPAGETHLTKNRVARLAGCDYSHFADYEIHESTATPEWVRKFSWMRETYNLTAPPDTLRAVDWKKLVAEDRTFADSNDSLGLQLADIAATSLRRAFNGNLKKPGWESFGRLLVAKEKGPFFMLDTSSAGAEVEGTALSVWESISSHAKPMIVEPSVA